jgi:hypothetical protein
LLLSSGRIVGICGLQNLKCDAAGIKTLASEDHTRRRNNYSLVLFLLLNLAGMDFIQTFYFC